jgi:hypothetical protein
MLSTRKFHYSTKKLVVLYFPRCVRSATELRQPKWCTIVERKSLLLKSHCVRNTICLNCLFKEVDNGVQGSQRFVLTRGSSRDGLTLNHLAQGSLTLNHFPPRRFNVKPLCQSSLHRRVSGLRALLYGTLRLQLTLAG